jgi:flavin reductase (DIM6/NTAB) family NADH-FMN oxidoreductase RutF
MTFDSDLLRRAMRAWTTGVAIIMASHADKTYGMTINSFTSLSIDPPLVSVALQNSTRMYDLVTKSRAFGVTILSADQQGLAEDFAGRKHGEERMTGIETQTFVTGAPVLFGGLASLDCRVIHTHAAGPNTVFIAEVAETRVQSTEPPLVYHNREYHHL